MTKKNKVIGEIERLFTDDKEILRRVISKTISEDKSFTHVLTDEKIPYGNFKYISAHVSQIDVLGFRLSWEYTGTYGG